MSNLSNFKNAFAGGGARPNLFEVELYFPDAISGNNASSLSRFMVKGAQLPASVITPIEVPYRGRKLKVAGDRTFDPWTITVINDVNMEIRNAFEEWMNLINRHASNTTSGRIGPLNYYKDLVVKQLSRDGSSEAPTKAYTFVGAFPTNIAAIELNYETDGAIEEFTVELSYQYWTSNTTLG
jgi:hypothetical protein